MTRKGESVRSVRYTRHHTYFKWGKWWTSEEDFEAYQQHQINRLRANRAGYDDVEKFLEMEKQSRSAIEQTRRREARMKNELNRLRTKHGLPVTANRTHLKKAYERTGDPDIAAYLNIQNTLTASDSEKVAKIRKLFLDGELSPVEILYETALVVGINLRKK